MFCVCEIVLSLTTRIDLINIKKLGWGSCPICREVVCMKGIMCALCVWVCFSVLKNKEGGMFFADKLEW